VGCGEQQKDWLLLAAKLDFQDGRSVKANGTLSLAFLMLLTCHLLPCRSGLPAEHLP
jgi:hypothetical protein